MEEVKQAEIQTGAVISYEDCPRCKQKGSVILETHVTGEQAGSCGSCGYSYTRAVLTSKEGPILDSENRFIYTTKSIDNPFAALHVIPKEGDAQMYCIATEEDYNEKIIPYLKEHKDLIEEAILCQFINNEITRKNILTEI